MGWKAVTVSLCWQRSDRIPINIVVSSGGCIIAVKARRGVVLFFFFVNAVNGCSVVLVTIVRFDDLGILVLRVIVFCCRNSSRGDFDFFSRPAKMFPPLEKEEEKVFVLVSSAKLVVATHL